MRCEQLRRMFWVLVVFGGIFLCSCESGQMQAGKPINLIGNNLTQWQDGKTGWEIVGDAYMDPEYEKLLATKPGGGVLVNGPVGRAKNILSKAEFGDVEAHIEFIVPKGSNSGVYFMSRYEIQIFDSYGVEKPQHSDCGGIYQRWAKHREPPGFDGIAPRVNASRPAGEWQSFDVIFRAPRFDEQGNKTANAKFEKVVHNGKVVHENAELSGPTRASTFNDEQARGPLMLQGDHGPVAYRNIIIRELSEPKKQ